jgi:hypothetical protein
VFVDAGHRLLITAPGLDSIFAPHIKGGFYDDSLIALYSKMEKDIDRNCISKFDRFERFRSDTTVARDTIMKYYEEYKEAHRAPEEMKKLYLLSPTVSTTVNSLPIFLSKCQIREKEVSELKNRFERLTPK